jgi:hypothetical protein
LISFEFLFRVRQEKGTRSANLRREGSAFCDSLKIKQLEAKDDSGESTEGLGKEQKR